ncbi:MAG: methyltransferase domain-containing protein [Solirubrobacterales bacterium]|nr:methyltransferase domain-containing protein [Solirubrobacterales bacterium]
MDEQADLDPSGPDWSVSAGKAWVEVQDLTDSVYAPVERLLTDEVGDGPGRRVLDVGCGTGATTVAIARRLGADARCTGIDVSEPMVEAAQERARTAGVEADFLLADAQTHDFGEGVFDQVVSRWGLMFFADPVAAFSNLRRAAAGGRLRAISWRSHTENPFMTVAESAAAPLLPGFEPRRSDDAPGQFGLADEAATAEILRDAGWEDVTLRPVDVTCSFPEAELVRYFLGLGPLARHLDGLSPAEVPDELVGTVRRAFDPYLADGQVSFDAACWMIGASSPA